MTLRLYQAGLQIVCKNTTAKYNLLQAGLQVTVRRKNPVYNLYQGGIQTVLRRLDMPQHAQYSFYDLPLEVVYEPAPETIQFSHCLEAGYFFAVDHNARITEGNTLSLKVYGGVPPYTWALEIGSTLALSATTTDDPEVTISIPGAFVSGTEEITVEDSCGSIATVCVYLCLDYDVSSYTCTTEYTCSEHCRRAVVPIEPPTPPPPVPPPPIPPPEPPLAPHETKVLTADFSADLTGLNLLIVSFYNAPDNTEVRLLWDLDTMAPLTGSHIVTLAEYEARYGFLGSVTWLDDLLVVGDSAALPTINLQNYDGTLNLTVSDFGYAITNDQSWGCGNTFTKADFVPLWCEDSEGICYGGPCGGVNFVSPDFFDECTLMPPWDNLEVTKNGTGRNLNFCSDSQLHTWPDSGGPNWATSYSYTFSGVQSYDALLYFNINWLSCPPWSYARLVDSDVDVYHTIANISISAIDLALDANENHGYPKGITYTDPGDWGSFSLVPGSDPEFVADPSFIRTSLQYAGTFFQEGDGSFRWDASDGCENLAEGALGGYGSWVPVHEELTYEYFTHFERIGLFYPYLGLRRGEETGHQKIEIVANSDLQCQIFLFQRSETTTYISDKTVREGTFHAALETGELKAAAPEKLPRRTSFEMALGQLFDRYYEENDYDSGGDMSSKIDPNLIIRVGVVSFSSLFNFYDLPLEVVYERS